ncbi:gallinacin-1 alpha-like [Struthio camelus]|uniref:gallinacin-1 alpha-like n=1 Tax=Struthio camelus TaxID=8801 RepID=UPI0036040200
MRILYLLFPFFLLLLQGAAGLSQLPVNEAQCRQVGGYCGLRICNFPSRFLGLCTRNHPCCSSALEQQEEEGEEKVQDPHG